MADKPGRKTGLGFNPKTTPKLFLEYCSQGLSLVQISNKLGISLDSLKKYQDYALMKASWIKGREANQAYHESLLDLMIKGIDANGEVKRYAAKEIDAQIYRLRVRFKEDWSEKVESKVQVEHSYESLSLDEIRSSLKQAVVKPSARKLLAETGLSSIKDNEAMH
jgi:hypothetical protein